MEHNFRDVGFSKLCRLMHETLLPPGNRFPPSWYLVKRILGIQSLGLHEYHVCKKGCCTWEPIPKEQVPCPFPPHAMQQLDTVLAHWMERMHRPASSHPCKHAAHGASVPG